MTINYSVTGTDRKRLVTAISQVLNAPMKYLGMPTAAYEVGGYHIDKNGTVTGEDNHELVNTLRESHDFIAGSEEYDGNENAVVDDPIHLGSDTFRYHGNPSAPITEAMVRQMEEIPMPPFENLQMTETEEMGIGRRHCDLWGEDGMQASDVLNVDTLLISLPREGFTDMAMANLHRLIESKGNLITKALGTNSLPIEVTDNTIGFPWFTGTLDANEVSAYTRFITSLCDMAKTQKRITATAKDTDNEKYAFRCFLLRLGFIGDDYKADRRVLLSRLEGNGAFKSKTNTPTDLNAADYNTVPHNTQIAQQINKAVAEHE